MKSIGLLGFIFALLLAVGCNSTKKDGKASPKGASVSPQSSWKSIISAFELDRAIKSEEGVVVIDVRSADKYAAGHIPGAINLPGNSLRTGKAKPGAGDSQYIFRTVGNVPDVAKYENILGQAGLARGDHVVVYGNHAGKADGTIPAMILNWLGQEKVAFLDGVGLEQWKSAGYETETTTNTLPATSYAATPSDDFVWNLPQVLEAVKDGSATFIDTRSLGEFNGTTLRDNKNGGRIPGAIRHDYADLLDNKKCVVDQDTAREQLDALKLPKNKPLVLYCQTATRVSLNYMVLKELGYEKVGIYDASWHEYGNVEGVPIEK